MKKLAAVDIDGTLLNDKKQLDIFTIETIHKLSLEGVVFAFATGRISGELNELKAKLPEVGYAITCNGAYVNELSSGKELYENLLPMQDVNIILNTLKGYDIMPELFAEGNVLTGEDMLENISHYCVANLRELILNTRKGVANFDEYLKTRKNPVGKLNVFFTCASQRNKAYELCKALNYDITFQEEANLEFNRRGVNKGDGLKQLLKALGIEKSDVIAIGDNQNDISLRDTASTFVAMGNACREVKALADMVAPDNNSCGAARALLELLSR